MHPEISATMRRKRWSFGRAGSGSSLKLRRTHEGVDLLCNAEHTQRVRATLLARGAIEVSAAAAECLRVEHGRPRYGLDMGFAGGDNFAAVYNDMVFWKAIGTTAWFVTLAVSIETLLGLLLALIVARELRFSGLIRPRNER